MAWPLLMRSGRSACRVVAAAGLLAVGLLAVGLLEGGGRAAGGRAGKAPGPVQEARVSTMNKTINVDDRGRTEGIAGMAVPHSGQRSTLARRSYPQDRQRPLMATAVRRRRSTRIRKTAGR